MDIDHAKVNSDTFLAEYRHGRVVLFTVHGNGELVQVWVSFSANFKSAVIDHDVASIKELLVARIIIVRREDKSSAIYLHKSQFWRFLDIDEQAEAFRHSDTLAIDGRMQIPPSRNF